MSDSHSRRLPHFDCIGRPVFLTWRLAGSLPRGRAFPDHNPSGKAFIAMDRLLDNARTGPTHLRRPEIAQMVVEAIVMANYVHLLITPSESISRIRQSLKRFTAREANCLLAQTGQPFWQEESYDRMVRDKTEFDRIARYIENNPVRAGLVSNPEDFPWSSVGQDGILQAGCQPAFTPPPPRTRSRPSHPSADELLRPSPLPGDSPGNTSRTSH